MNAETADGSSSTATTWKSFCTAARDGRQWLPSGAGSRSRLELAGGDVVWSSREVPSTVRAKLVILLHLLAISNSIRTTPSGVEQGLFVAGVGSGTHSTPWCACTCTDSRNNAGEDKRYAEARRRCRRLQIACTERMNATSPVAPIVSSVQMKENPPGS